MSTAPRIHYGAGIWQIPQVQARGEGQPALAGQALTGRSFASPAWRAPAMQHAQDGSLHSLQGATMGTTWSLRLANPDYAPLAPVQALVQHTLDAVIAQMSNWEADSCLSRFNVADAGSWHTLPPELAQVLDAALHWARACDGAYDPTVGALVSLWGFGPRANPQAPHSGQAPAQADIDRALQVCGHQRLQWQPQQWLPQQRRLLQPGGLQLDLSGIAKGYAVDWVAERLRAA
ncbi:MAG: FAD:protein FMN transferase, partial [Comamonas sp.]|nr:FAD:protein FMN transferase [Comamonas sp.]